MQARCLFFLFIFFLGTRLIEEIIFPIGEIGTPKTIPATDTIFQEITVITIITILRKIRAVTLSTIYTFKTKLAFDAIEHIQA